MTRRDWIVFTSIAAPLAAVGESSFKAPAAADMPAKIQQDQVTIGIDAFDTAGKVAKAFGKLDPNKYEILPVLVVIQNDRQGPLRVSPLEVQYIVPGQGKIDALHGDEVVAAGGGPSRPNLGPKPLPLPTRVKKNPLRAPEIEGRAFAAKVIAPGDSANGFFYFNIRHRTTAKLYLSGLYDTAARQELFYFEIPFVG